MKKTKIQIFIQLKNVSNKLLNKSFILSLLRNIKKYLIKIESIC